jgi:hypothetical protein
LVLIIKSFRKKRAKAQFNSNSGLFPSFLHHQSINSGMDAAIWPYNPLPEVNMLYLAGAKNSLHEKLIIKSRINIKWRIR